MLGVFEDTLDIPRRLTIRMHLDPRSGRWLTGDGATPIDPVDPGLSATYRELDRPDPPRIELIVEPVASFRPRKRPGD